MNNRERLLHRLISGLRAMDYHRVRIFPLRRYPPQSGLLINEAANLCRFLGGGTNIFAISLFPAVYTRLYGRRRPLVRLREHLFLNMVAPRPWWQKLATVPWCAEAEEAGLLVERNGGCRLDFRLVPHGNDVLVTSPYDRSAPDFTFLSFDSLYLSSFVRRRLTDLGIKARAGLDLCCGVGIQAFTISPWCEVVEGRDTSAPAIALAKLNADLCRYDNCRFTVASAGDDMQGTYDIIVANPPFLFFDAPGGPADSDGGEPLGLGVTGRIMVELPDLLGRSGRGFVLSRAPQTASGDLLHECLRTWVPAEMGWIYHEVSDSVTRPEPVERKHGVIGFRYVVIEVFWGHERGVHRLPLRHRTTHLF